MTSVKKLIVLGAVADVPENYNNVKVILDQLDVEALEFTMSADIKMCKWLNEVFLNFLKCIVLVMILVGKSAGKPFHGCPFCSASTPYMENGQLYTLGDLLDLHQVQKYLFFGRLIFFHT